MNQHVKRLVDEAAKLPPEDRAALLDHLLAGLYEQDGAWDAAWATEAEHRWATFKAGNQTTHDADDVLTDVTKRLAKYRAK
jgi:Putative addiction module component